MLLLKSSYVDDNTIKWLAGGEKRKKVFFSIFNDLNNLLWDSHIIVVPQFQTVLLLNPAYVNFGHFGCLKPVYDKMNYTSLYHGIYHPLAETAGHACVWYTLLYAFL